MPKIDPTLRRLTAQRAAYVLHAQVEDPTAHTAPARAAFEARFYVGIPEDLPQSERDRRALYARKAYFTELAIASVKARQSKGAA